MEADECGVGCGTFGGGFVVETDVVLAEGWFVDLDVIEVGFDEKQKSAHVESNI